MGMDRYNCQGAFLLFGKPYGYLNILDRASWKDETPVKGPS
jgi:hypothetical protein